MTREHPWEDLLASARKPQQYVGCEWGGVPTRAGLPDVTLAYPDTYELGMSNFGLAVVRHLLVESGRFNVRRAYCPAPDLYSRLCASGRELVCVEDAFPVSRSSVIGFGVPAEALYTNILRMLSLAGLPALASERLESAPVVVAGGGGLANPLPLSPFIDVFYLGDAEEHAVELFEALSGGGGRRARLSEVAGIPGVWVPSLGPKPVTVQRVSALRQADAPVRQLVPLCQVAHDRAVVEIARGCSRGCRFCQAGFLSRPVRERKPAEVMDLLERSLGATGWEEAGLLSLSFSDYSRLEELLPCLADFERRTGISVSKPSLRPDTFARLEGFGRISGRITLAPEAGTERLRWKLNKCMTDKDIIESFDMAFDLGAKGVKLYFLVGLPDETDEDLEGIGALARAACNAASRHRRNPGASVSVALSPFVPKPATPLQWAPQAGWSELWRRIRFTASRCGRASVGWNDPGLAVVEAVLGLGDGDSTPGLLSAAVDAGAGFDGWSDRFRWDVWRELIGNRPGLEGRLRDGLDPGDPLPWDFISTGVSRGHLLEELERFGRGEATPDCREAGCSGCGACGEGGSPCDSWSAASRDGSSGGPCVIAGQGSAGADAFGGRPACVARFWYSKRGLARFSSHLDTVRMWMRVFRRAGLEAVTRGSHVKRQRIRFGPALPLGFSGSAECVDVLLGAPPPPGMQEAVSRSLPPGFGLLRARVLPPDTPAPDREAALAEYAVMCDIPDPETLMRFEGVRGARMEGGTLLLEIDMSCPKARPDRLLEEAGVAFGSIERTGLFGVSDGRRHPLAGAEGGDDPA